MKLLRRHSNKSEHVEFLFLVEKLSPWPTSHGSLAVQWQRGGKRAGQTKPTWPDTDEPSSVASYMFGETLIVPATLYRSAGGDFEDKTLQFFVAQVDDKGKELNVLGGLELNLAEFASIQGHIRQEFAIECSSAVWGPAGGRPRLTLSIGAARGGERTADLAAAMSDLVSVDAMPSTLSTDEDDVSRPSSRVGGHNPSRSGLRSVREDAEELEDSDAARSVVGPTPPTVMQAHRDPGHAYDSDGFLMDSELAAKESPSVSQNNAASASPSTVKRNLGQEMDSVNVAQQMERLSVLGDTTLADEVAAHPDRYDINTHTCDQVLPAFISTPMSGSGISSHSFTISPRV